MRTFRPLLVAVAVLCGAITVPTTAEAAETHNTCTGFIDSVPATITTQGVWCLRKDLATPNTSGAAITIATNNVTIDCNNFKVGGLAAGNASNADGIFSEERQNITVRHCNLRGFRNGINLRKGAGHLVEDNRFDNNLTTGVNLFYTDNSMVRRNRVFDTGGAPGKVHAFAIRAAADVVDNVVSGVFLPSSVASGDAYGIEGDGTGTTVRGNFVRGLVPRGTGSAIGIRSQGASMIIDANHVTGGFSGMSVVGLAGVSDTVCINNVAIGFAIHYRFCGEYTHGNIPF